MTNIRCLRRLAESLKRYASKATLPGYRERLLRAAQEVETQAALQSPTDESAGTIKPAEVSAA